MEAWNNEKWMELSHVSAVALIQIRLVYDLQDLQNATRALQDTLPAEILGMVKECLVGGMIRPKILKADTEEISRLIKELKGQLRKIHAVVDEYNPRYWKLLLQNARAAAENRIDSAYGYQTPEQACLVLELQLRGMGRNIGGDEGATGHQKRTRDHNMSAR